MPCTGCTYGGCALCDNFDKHTREPKEEVMELAGKTAKKTVKKMTTKKAVKVKK